MPLRFPTALLATLAVASPLAAEDLRIEHDPPRCVVAERFPVLRARFHPAGAARRAKVFFRVPGSPHWYAVAMRADGPVHVAALPRPKKDLKAFAYYIEVVGADAGAARTAEAEPAVVAGAGACRAGAVAGTVESATVLVEAPGGAPAAVPTGFSAAGVTPAAGGAVAAGATAAGAAGAAAAGAAAASGGGIATTALVAGGVLAAGAAAAVVLRDGGGGPCTEGGGFEFAAESSLEGGEWACAVSHTLVLRVRNHSCEEMRFGQGSHHRVETTAFGTNRTPDSGFTLDDVEPGGERVQSEPQAPFIACKNPQAPPSPPGPDRRAVEWTFSISSNLGMATDTVRFTFDFGVCPPCPR